MRSASTPACSSSCAAMRSESCLASSVTFADSALASSSALACIASASASFLAASALSASAARTASCCFCISALHRRRRRTSQMMKHDDREADQLPDEDRHLAGSRLISRRRRGSGWPAWPTVRRPTTASSDCVGRALFGQLLVRCAHGVGDLAAGLGTLLVDDLAARGAGLVADRRRLGPRAVPSPRRSRPARPRPARPTCGCPRRSWPAWPRARRGPC